VLLVLVECVCDPRELNQRATRSVASEVQFPVGALPVRQSLTDVPFVSLTVLPRGRLPTDLRKPSVCSVSTRRRLANVPLAPLAGLPVGAQNLVFET